MSDQELSPIDPNFESRVRTSFERQPFMSLIGAELVSVEAGRVVVEIPVRPELTQQHGYIHAGVTTTIADVAGGYAASTLYLAESSVLTVEMKINLMAPAGGTRLRAVGRVLRAGRRISSTEADVFALYPDGREEICAKMLQTMTQVRSRIEKA